MYALISIVLSSIVLELNGQIFIVLNSFLIFFLNIYLSRALFNQPMSFINILISNHDIVSFSSKGCFERLEISSKVIKHEKYVKVMCICPTQTIVLVLLLLELHVNDNTL